MRVPVWTTGQQARRYRVMRSRKNKLLLRRPWLAARRTTVGGPIMSGPMDVDRVQAYDPSLSGAGLPYHQAAPCAITARCEDVPFVISRKET